MKKTSSVWWNRIILLLYGDKDKLNISNSPFVMIRKKTGLIAIKKLFVHLILIKANRVIFKNKHRKLSVSVSSKHEHFIPSILCDL
jgi:hypothetical protein